MAWRRRLLGASALLVLLIAIVFGCFVRQWYRAEAQRRAVLAVSLRGAFVRYDDRWSGGQAITQRNRIWLRWLVDWLGRDYFRHVVIVEFDPEDRVTDSDLAYVASFSQLEELGLSGTNISNESLIHLTDLAGLRVLELSDTAVDNRGLVHLKRLSGLRSLSIDNDNVSDAGLACLSGLVGLEELHLKNIDVGDAGLAHLEKLTQLRVLDLSDTRVSNRGLSHLLGMQKLKNLDVRSTMVNDFGVYEFRHALPKVEVLYTHLRL
jgi:Leucine-rich repeat (LRR) protein